MAMTDRADPRRAVQLRSVLLSTEERAADARDFLYGKGDADVARRAAEVRASIDPNAPRRRRSITLDLDPATAAMFESDAASMGKSPEQVMAHALDAAVSQRRR